MSMTETNVQYLRREVEQLQEQLQGMLEEADENLRKARDKIEEAEGNVEDYKTELDVRVDSMQEVLGRMDDTYDIERVKEIVSELYEMLFTDR